MDVLWIAPLVAAWMVCFGWLLLRRVWLSPAERAWLVPSVGLAAITLAAAFLAFIQALNVAGVLTALGILLLAAAFLGVSIVPSFLARPEDEFEPVQEGGPGLVGAISPVVVVAILFHTLMGALTPEVRSDPVRYHIAMANQYAVRGGLEPLRETVWWTIPQYGECLFALGIVMANDTLAKLFHWFAGALSILGVFALAERWHGPKAAWWSVLLWATTAKLSYEMTATYVEAFLILWIEIAVWAAAAGLRIQSKGGRPLFWVVLSGAFLGLACGTKYTVLAVQALPWLVFPLTAAFRARNGGWKSTCQLLGIPLLAIAAVDGPWLCRNIFHTGNPFYPLYNRWFGLTSEYDRGAELFFLTVWPGKHLLDPGFYLERLERFTLSGFHFPFLVILLMAAFLIRRRSQAAKGMLPFPYSVALGFCLVSLACYILLTGNTDGRFWLPTLAVFTVFLGAGLARLVPLFLEESGPNQQHRRNVWEALVVLLFTAFLLNSYIGQRKSFFLAHEESVWPILSEEARWEYYREHERGDPLGKGFDELLGPDAFVYGLGFPHRVKGISLVIETVRDAEGHLFQSNPDPLRTPFEESDQTPESLVRIARDRGITHLVPPRSSKVEDDPFWKTVRQVCPTVPGSEGRLFQVPVPR